MITDKHKKITEYILPAIVTGILFLVILAINGLWPFGGDTIDYYDMAQQAEAYYYHNFDQLHGLKSFVFDWYTNLGRGIPGLSEPSLYDLLLFLIPRGSILQAMSLMMMVKIMAAAFFMGLFLEYVNPDMPFVYRLMTASGYGLCGFVLANYTIPQWVDMASFVPLVLMFSQKALKTGKITGLSVSVFLIAVTDTYFAIQMLMLMFMIGGAYILCTFRSERLFLKRFLSGIVAGIGLSAFSFIPDIAYSLSSARFENGAGDTGLLGSYLTILQTVTPAYLSRWFALLSLAFPVALTGVGTVSLFRKKQYGKVVFSLTCIIMPVAQLLFESIHLILHFGSYVNYPVRNSYMIYCIFAGVAAASCEWAPEENDKTSRQFAMIIAGAVPSIIVAVFFARLYASGSGITSHDVLIFTMSFMFVCTILHMVLFHINRTGAAYARVALWSAELLIFGIIMIGKPLYASDYGNEPEQEGEYIRIADQLVAGLSGYLDTGDEAKMCRIKNPDTSLNSNYGMIMRREALSGWTSLISADQISGATAFGYSSQFTRLLDSGGNIFSDTLIHITDVIGTEEQDEKLFDNIASVTVVTDHTTGQKREYHLSKNRFVMPFAIPIRDKEALYDVRKDTVELVNSYARAIGATDDIAAYADKQTEDTSEDGHTVITSVISVKGMQSLYMVGGCIDCEYRNTKIYVNGKGIMIPSIKEPGNELYPAHFNNNSIALGTFENENVEVTIDIDTGISDHLIDSRIYMIDIGALSEICAGMPKGIKTQQEKRSLDITTSGLDAGYEGLLIPVPYSDGWTAKVNGKTSNLEGISGLFMYIPLQPGDNTIHISYYPPYMKTGIAIAIITASAVALAFYFDRKAAPKTTAADDVLAKLYVVVFGAAVVVIYIVPVLYAVFFT